MQFWAYAFPAMLALLAKVGIFFYARHSKIQNLQTQLYLLFLFALSIQNVAEITILVSHAEGSNDPSGGRLYFGTSILAIALFLHLALVMSRNSTRPGNNISFRGIVFLYAPPVILEALLWYTPLLISTFERTTYTYTKVPGSLYALFELFAVGYLCAAASLFFYGAATQVKTFKRLQNKFLLIGLLPFVAVVVTVIVLQHLGVHGVSATTTLPIALTFFLAVTAYATHQHRLFDIEFFLPWSRVRKRKTAFYRRIQLLVSEIAEMSSVQKIIRSISDALHCPVALIGGPKPALAMAGEAFGIARFPLGELKKIDRIVIANEISQAMPATYELMQRHKVAVIVPFHPHSQAAASWMLLGEAFSEQVYSPLDFKTVETLFSRLADHFLDNQLLLRSQLNEAQREMNTLQERLANAWEQIEILHRKLAETADDNRPVGHIRAEALHNSLSTIQSELLEVHAASEKSLVEHVAEFESRLIAKTLEYCEDDVSRAAELLGLPVTTLYYKLQHYHLIKNHKKRT